MSEQVPDPKTAALAAKLLERMLRDAGKGDLCPHCVGLEMIYQISKEMTANTDVEAGELFNAVHVGAVDGADERNDEDAGDGGTGWTLH